MSWTYNVNTLATSSLTQVRLLIGDTKSGDQLMQDEEINWAVTRYTNVELAAAECCRTLAGRFSREVDIVQGELKTNYSNKAKAYKAMAADLETRGMSRGGVMPFAGGISAADKNARVLDTDRTPPNFNRGEFDNYLPIAPVGQQTPDATSEQPEPPPS